MSDSTGIGMEGAEVAFEESSQVIAKDIVVTAESIKQAARDVLKVAELLHDKEEIKKISSQNRVKKILEELEEEASHEE